MEDLQNRKEKDRKKIKMKKKDPTFLHVADYMFRRK